MFIAIPSIKVWVFATLRQAESKRGQELLTLTAHTSYVYGVAVSADGRRGLSASADHTVKVWSLTDGRVLATFDAGEALHCCAFAPDGVTIVAAGPSGRMHFLRLEGLSTDFGSGLNGE